MSEAASARDRAGLTIEDAARQARVCVRYLRRVERSGDCSYPLAMRLARLYRCSANVFLYSKGSEIRKERAIKRQQTKKALTD